MPKIHPFSALRYDRERVALKKVVCPPYDVINRRQRRDYIKHSPHNIVRIVLPERKNRHRDYDRAKRDFYNLVKKGILKEDRSPAIYIYQQEFRLGRRILSHCGFLSLMELEGRRAALPHERIFSGPLLDRTNLMKKTRAHLSPIFTIFKDHNGLIYKLLLDRIRRTPADVDIHFEGVRHKLWNITEATFLKRLSKLMKRTKVFIADGHHRFEASVIVKEYFHSRCKKNPKDKGYKHTLVYLVSSEDKGLTILPTHRAVKNLPEGFSMEYMLKRLNGYFKVRPVVAGRIKYSLRKAAAKGEVAFVIFYDNRYLFIELKGDRIPHKQLDVSILHNLIFAKLFGIKERVRSHRNIYYYKDLKEVVEKVSSGEQRLGVFLNPTKMEEVQRIAEADERMPHKSTYFYPKPLTGLVIHKF